MELVAFDFAVRLDFFPGDHLLAEYECPQTLRKGRVRFVLPYKDRKRLLNGNQLVRFWQCECGFDHWCTIAFMPTWEGCQRAIMGSPFNYHAAWLQ